MPDSLEPTMSPFSSLAPQHSTREIQFCCLRGINGSSGGFVQPGGSAISSCWLCSPSAVWVFWSTLAAVVSPCPLFAALPPPPRVTASTYSLASPSPDPTRFAGSEACPVLLPVPGKWAGASATEFSLLGNWPFSGISAMDGGPCLHSRNYGLQQGREKRGQQKTESVSRSVVSDSL